MLKRPSINSGESSVRRDGGGLRARASSPGGWLALLACLGCQEALGQFQERIGADDRFISRTAPFPVLGGGDQANYNIKWRRITARLRGSVQVEYNDNLTMNGSRPEGDVFVAPHIGTGIFWPMSRKNTLQFDLDIGYRYYFKYSKLNSFYVSPSSHIEYRMMIGDVRINFHDDFSIQVDPVSRPEISGVGRSSPVIFRRFVNTAGASASWQASENWTFVGGYDFTIDRSLADDYASIDRNAHTFSAAVYRTMPPQWTFGVHASYSITDYLQHIQHDGWGYSFGPLAVYQASRNVQFDAGVDWSVSRFDSSGTIADRSNFQGMTYRVGARHLFNPHMQHHIGLRKSVDLGLGSNYTDMLAIQYGISAALRRDLTVNAIISYDNSTVSGVGGETSDRYLFYIGSSFAVSARWNLALGYSYAMKNSDQAGRDYTQNRVTLDASYRF